MAFGQIQWARQTIEGRQIEATGGKLLNFYSISPDDQSKIANILYHAPGKRKWANSFDGLTINGILASDSPIYGERLSVVAGNKFFQIRPGRVGNTDMVARYAPDYTPDEDVFTPLAAHTRDLPAGFTYTNADGVAIPGFAPDEVCRMATDGRRVMFVQGRNLAIFDADVASNNDGGAGAGGFVEVLAPTATDQSATLPDSEWVDVAWIDGYFIVAARSGELFHSVLERAEFDQIDFASASSNSDPITSLAVYNRRLFVMGSETVETWYNAGNPTGFAFSRDNSFVANIGCVATAASYQDEAGIYFVGHDKSVYANLSGQFRRISNETVEYDLARADTTQCRAYGYVEEGHRFYSVTMFLDVKRLEDNEREELGLLPARALTAKERVSLGLQYTDDEFAQLEMMPPHPLTTAERVLLGHPPEDPEVVPKNWTYDLQTNLWHVRTETGVLAAEEFIGVNLVAVADALFNQSLRFGDNDFQPVLRVAVTPVLYANQNRVICHSFEIDVPIRAARFDHIPPEIDDPDNPGEMIPNPDHPDQTDSTKLTWSDDAFYSERGVCRPTQPIGEKRPARMKWTQLGSFGRGVVLS